MSRQLSLAAGTVLDADPPGTVTAAAAAGFDASGVWFDPGTWTPAVAVETRHRLDATGLVALDIEVVRLRRDGDLGTAFALIDAGADVGASFVLCVSLDPDLHRTADHLARVAEHAAAAGLRPVLEPMRFTTVRSLADAVAVVVACGHPSAGVLVDALHLARCGETPDDVATVDRHLLPYAQLCDAKAEGPGDDGLVTEALDGRLLPGEGGLPLVALLDALPPGAPISMEMRSKALRDAYPDPVDRARAVARASRRLPGLTGLAGPC